MYVAKPFAELANETFPNVRSRNGKYRGYLDILTTDKKTWKMSFQLPPLTTTNGFREVETENKDGTISKSFVLHLDLGKPGERSEEQQSVIDTVEKVKENMYNVMTRVYPNLGNLPKDKVFDRCKTGVSESFTTDTVYTGHTFRVAFPPHQTWYDDPSGATRADGKVKQLPGEKDMSLLNEPLRQFFKVPLAVDKKGSEMPNTVEAAKEFLAAGYNLRVIVQIEKVSVNRNATEAGFNLSWQAAAIVRLDRKPGSENRGTKRSLDTFVIPGFNDDIKVSTPVKSVSEDESSKRVKEDEDSGENLEENVNDDCADEQKLENSESPDEAE